MLREHDQWCLLTAAIEGIRPRIMTPAETDFYESVYAEIQKHKAEGREYEYYIPSDMPEHGICLYVTELPEEKGELILAMKELITEFYEKAALLSYEDGSAHVVPAEERDVLVFSRCIERRIWLPMDENTGIPEYLRYMAYVLTAGLISNYSVSGNAPFPLAEDLISRMMELTILRYYSENWDKVTDKIPTAGKADREQIRGLISDLEKGEKPLRVREIGLDYMGRPDPERNVRVIRSFDDKTASERQRIAVRLAELLDKEDLTPLILLREYSTKDGRLRADWLKKNYPRSKLLRELISLT